MVIHHCSHHLIARGLTFTGDFRSALHHEKITYNIHKEKVSLLIVTITLILSMVYIAVVVILSGTSL